MSPRAASTAPAAPVRNPGVRARVREDDADGLALFNDLVIWLNTNAGTDLPTVDQLQGPLVTLWEAPLSDTTPPERGVPWQARLELAWHPIPPGSLAVACTVHVILPPAPELPVAGRRRRG